MGVRVKIAAPRIVQPGGGTARWIGVLIGLTLLVGLGWMVFDFGRDWAGYADSRAARAVKRLNANLEAAEQERDRLRQQVASLQRAGQIDREANRVAQEELKKQQEVALKLEKEVALLRNLLEQEAKGVLRIQELKLTSTGQERVYSYRFTVSQMREGFGVSRGTVEVSVDGVQNGESKRLSLGELASEEKDGHKMRFRHFQKISGTIRLPEGFTPDSLVVEVKPTTKRLMPLSEVFDWVVGG